MAPLGQVFGYWAPDLWPAQVIPSVVLGRLEVGGRPTSAAVRWPAALAGILAGWLICWSMGKALGLRAGLLFGLCWFSSLGLIDRSSGTGLNLIMGLGTLAAIERLISRGSDRVAGLWACFAFLAGGWPPLVVIGLSIIVIGKKSAYFSLRLVRAATADGDRLVFLDRVGFLRRGLGGRTHAPHDPESRLGLLGPALTMGFPGAHSPCSVLSRSVRESWKPDSRPWMIGWLRVALACLIAGTLVPGLSQVALVVSLAGLTVGAAACLESAWTPNVCRSPARRVLRRVWMRDRVVAGRHALRKLCVEPGHAVLPSAGRDNEHHGPLRGVPRLVGHGDRQLAARADHTGGYRIRSKVDSLGLLRPRIELPV